MDPALCLYYGARFICVMDNKALSERVPRGNGTMCRFLSIKLKPDATSVRTKLFHGRKIRTVNARDVEYIECEVIDNSSHIKALTHQLQLLCKNKKRNKQQIRTIRQQIKIERRNKTFHLETVTSTTTVKCSINKYTPPLTFKTIMTQFPINLADAVTGHKLQGRTIEKMIVTAWGLAFMKNWEYTVLSWVKSRKGLYLFEKLDIHKSYAAKPDFQKFIR